MRPVMRGMVQYPHLLDGTLTLVDMARMNEAIDVQNENERRLMDR